ncbi:hypothetical protein IFM89_011453 [Coptis chinensis]|uniref:Uncharacterized protein n=1 Tax=Coptis chinensis TaxID=261450 RepID=A0A835M9N5_9MAGN|nr:hypothetical protein IFM89_011453 [Coptis chinensis]
MKHMLVMTEPRLRRESEVINGNVSHQDNVKTASENLSPDSPRIETQVNHQTGHFTDEKEQVLESVNNTEQAVERSPLLHSPDGNGPLDYENNIIGEREKLKKLMNLNVQQRKNGHPGSASYKFRFGICRHLLFVFIFSMLEFIEIL